jgi:sarcosine oxidase / L-pipecolate oxidase
LELYADSSAAQFDSLLGPVAKSGYLNLDGGWADARKGIERALLKVQELGGKVYAGKTMSKLLKTSDGLQTRGVECLDGSSYEADLVIVAAGAWTVSSVPELATLAGVAKATGYVSPKP